MYYMVILPSFVSVHILCFSALLGILRWEVRLLFRDVYIYTVFDFLRLVVDIVGYVLLMNLFRRCQSFSLVQELIEFALVTVARFTHLSIRAKGGFL